MKYKTTAYRPPNKYADESYVVTVLALLLDSSRFERASSSLHFFKIRIRPSECAENIPSTHIVSSASSSTPWTRECDKDLFRKASACGFPLVECIFDARRRMGGTLPRGFLGGRPRGRFWGGARSVAEFGTMVGAGRFSPEGEPSDS